MTGQPAGVRWDVEFSFPTLGGFRVQQSAEWVVPPEGIDPREYAQGRLAVACAGVDHRLRAEPALDALVAGDPIRCAVWHGPTLLAEVEGTRLP